MKPPPTMVLLLVALAAPALAVCGGAGPTSPRVIVQETNVDQPADTQPVVCDGHLVQRGTTRQCDGAEVRISICSESGLCSAQIDEIVREVASCSATAEEFSYTPSAKC